MFSAMCFNIMLSCPSDVSEEKEIFIKNIHEWNSINAEDKQIVIIPMDWENTVYPSSGEYPQEVINKQLLEKADILVAVFRMRMGSPTNDYISGTVEEISKFIEKGKKVLLYYYNGLIEQSEIDSSEKIEQYKILQKFKAGNTPYKGVYNEYNSAKDFSDKFSEHLQRLMIDIKNTNNIEKNNKNIPILNSGARLILEKLKNIPDDEDQILLKMHNSGSFIGYSYQIGVEEFPKIYNRENMAEFEDGKEQLLELGLLKINSTRKDSWILTSKGYSYKF